MSEHIFKHGNMTLVYEGGEGEAMRMSFLGTDAIEVPDTFAVAAPNFSLFLAGEDSEPMTGCASYSHANEWSYCKSFVQTKKGITAKYLAKDNTLEITVKMEFIPGTDAIRQTNSIKNIGKEKVTLTHFGSGLVTGIGKGGLTKWYRDDKRFKVHHLMSHWQGEAQWRENSLEELGIYKKTAHAWDSVAYRLRSVGSWSTGKHHPMMMLEDTETGVIWYMEIEGGYSWTIELGNRNGHALDEGTFYIEANAADEETGFVKTLHAGETYVAAPVIFGCTNGSYEEAAGELTKARRKTSVAKWNDENVAPACFNTYMNCIWLLDGRDMLPALIERAAECCAEVFCLDDGWQTISHGEWVINIEKFGKDGLKGIFDLIRSKGMLPGIWLEIESLHPDSQMAKNGVHLKRNGTGVCADHFADFTDKYNTDYIEARIDELYALGVRFIKNDYNRSTLYGAEIRGSSPAEGLKKHTEAFYAFIDRIKKKYPDLKIENCGSGAMRCDTGTLRHFELQSTTDQEFYDLNPAIISGMAAVLPPEKAGIWSYPYPVSFYENQTKEDIYANSDRMAALADGEQTVFNMVNSLCGVVYLSGRIDKADDFNFSLIKEGMEVYKEFRAHTAKALPVFPTGKHTLANRTHASLGLLSPDKKRMTLAVWKLEESADTVKVDLSKYFAGKKATVRLAYPTAIATNYKYFANTHTLVIEMPKKRTARFFEICVK